MAKLKVIIGPPVSGGNVDSVNGKVGVVLLDKSDIGLTNVDNTSDADKPISDATQTALNNLQQEIPNTDNLVNQFTTDTQGVIGRFTVQEPLDSNISDAASVGYVLGKTSLKSPIKDSVFTEKERKTAFIESKNQQFKRDNSPEVLDLESFESLKEYQDKIYSVKDVGTYFGSSLLSQPTFTYNQNDIHVKKTGNDSSGDGTESNPFLTIDKAITEAPILGGFNIWVYDGVYEENSQGIGYLFIENKNFTNKVSIRKVFGEKVILKAQSGTYACRLSGNCSNIVFSNLRIETISGNTGVYTHTSNSPIQNSGFIDCDFVDNFNTTLSIAADSSTETNNFFIKRCKFFTGGDFRTYFSNCINLDFIGNVYSSLSSSNPKAVRVFSGCGGQININSNTIESPNYILGWVLDFDSSLDYIDTVINIKSNTIKSGSRAIQVVGGSLNNPVELNISNNYIESEDTGITTNEYIDGGIIESNVIESNGSVGIGSPTDINFTANYSCKNQTIRYNIVNCLGNAGHALLIGERSENQNAYSNILNASITGRHGSVIKGINHTLKDNLIYGGDLDCIYLKGSQNTKVEGNTSFQDTGGACIRYSNDGSNNLPSDNFIIKNSFLASNGKIIEVFDTTIGVNNKQDKNVYGVIDSGIWGDMFNQSVLSLSEIVNSWDQNYSTNSDNDKGSIDNSFYFD